jgi:hypothetical protein
MIRIATARHSTTAWLVLASLLAASVATAKGTHGPAAQQVEVQISLCSDPDEVVRALGLEPRDTIRETWLFDDAALTLFERGLRFRVRATDSGTEITLKAAVDHCTGVSPALVPAKVGKCEYDMHGDSLTAAVSLSTRLYESTAKRLLAGRLALADALSATQVRYLTEAVKLWPLPPDLRQLGPINVLAYRARDRPYDVDVSRLPSGERYVEISRKVALADAVAARKSLDNDLARGGIAVCADQSAQAVNKLRALLRAN